MDKRLRAVGILAAVLGIVLASIGVYSFLEVRAGQSSLQAFSEAQNVKLSYNDEGQLVDRGETEGAENIMALLTEDWGYKVKKGELDPNDPLVNTPSEYMYQMATIAYHTLHGTQTIELKEDVEYEGQTYKAGTYDFEVNGRYWTGFDRKHPIEGPAREKAWSGTAHALIAELGVGTVTASTLLLGLGLSALAILMGFSIFVLGLGLVWASQPQEAVRPLSSLQPAPGVVRS